MIDTHAHFSCQRFDGEFSYLALNGKAQEVCTGTRESLLEQLQARGITAVVEPAIGLSSNQELLDLARQWPGFLYSAVGVHPTRTWQTEWKDRSQLQEFAQRPGVVAIGETGLDYHYDRKEQHRLIQLKWFLYQIELADRSRLPLILHIRQADRDALRVLRLFRKKLHGGVAHCFSGDWKTAQQYLKLHPNMFLGIGGTLLQNVPRAESLKEAVLNAPLERLLLETDAPFVLPAMEVPGSKKQLRKVRNTSLILPAVAEAIAELKGCSCERVEKVTAENAERLFSIP